MMTKSEQARFVERIIQDEGCIQFATLNKLLMKEAQEKYNGCMQAPLKSVLEELFMRARIRGYGKFVY